jgi:L-alanine-DL-glutamate epimerase-like enolase superfamily enzyme
VGTGFRKRSCASKKVKRDDDSKKSHRALTSPSRTPVVESAAAIVSVIGYTPTVWAKPVEWNDPEERDTALMQTIMRAPWRMRNGRFQLPSGPGLGIEIDSEQLDKRIRLVKTQVR